MEVRRAVKGACKWHGSPSCRYFRLLSGTHQFVSFLVIAFSRRPSLPKMAAFTIKMEPEDLSEGDFSYIAVQVKEECEDWGTCAAQDGECPGTGPIHSESCDSPCEDFVSPDSSGGTVNQQGKAQIRTGTAHLSKQTQDSLPGCHRDRVVAATKSQGAEGYRAKPCRGRPPCGMNERSVRHGGLTCDEGNRSCVSNEGKAQQCAECLKDLNSKEATRIDPPRSRKCSDDCESRMMTGDDPKEVTSEGLRDNAGWEEKGVTCNICGKGFRYESWLRIHKRNHSGEMPYQCEICLKLFTTKGNCMVHMRTHTGEKPFQCEVCQRFFCSKQFLKEHVQAHSGMKPYSCEVCLKCFSMKRTLKDHSRSHVEENLHRCSVCAKTFVWRNALQVHMRTHTGERPYACDFCQKSFTQKSTLKTHILIHTGERPYRCEVCSKRFSAKNSMHIHMRRHSADKPYECGVCSKTFKYSGNRAVHMKLHAESRPYACGICSKSYAIKSSLKKHMVCHSGEKPYACKICPRLFRKKADRDQHVLTHDGGDLLRVRCQSQELITQEPITQEPIPQVRPEGTPDGSD